MGAFLVRTAHRASAGSTCIVHAAAAQLPPASGSLTCCRAHTTSLTHQTYFNVTPAGEAAAAEAGAKGGAGGWEKTADGKIAACDPKAMLNALMYEALAAGDVEGVEKYLNYGARLDHREVIHEGGASECAAVAAAASHLSLCAQPLTIV